MSLLREGLLEGRAVVVAGASDRVASALASLGARVEPLEVAGLSSEEEQVGEWARARAPLGALVFDARSFVAGGLMTALESAWIAVREVAVGALIPGEGAGKVVLIAPGSGALCAGLENLARTLSVEWARYGITTVSVAVATDGEEDGLAELVCFLCSAGGEYFSGCRLDLGALSAAG